MTILVADDSEKNRELLRTVLGHMGHIVVEAANGREAVDEAERMNPDVMILDLQKLTLIQLVVMVSHLKPLFAKFSFFLTQA
jgi:CheY-like chemotaxis protein